MNYNEFNQMLTNEGLDEVSYNEYLTIEKVYMNHPIIKDVEGKTQIFNLYKIGGMLLINDMAKRVTEILEIEKSNRNLQMAIDDLESEWHCETLKLEKIYNEKISTLKLRQVELKNKQLELLN